MPNTNIILIAYHFPPENTVGALRPHRFYKYLKRLGYTCHVVTACPQKEPLPDITFVPDRSREYLEKSERNGSAPVTIQIEKVIRKFLLPGHLGTTWWMAAAKACSRIIAGANGTRTVLYSTYPPMGSHLAGLSVARKHNLPWVADFRDPMGLDPMLYQMPPLSRRTLQLTENRIVRRARRVLLTVQSARDLYANTYPDAKDKFHVIWNGFDPESQAHPQPISNPAKKVLIHTGSLYHGRNANVIVESIARLRSRNSAATQSLLLRLIGDVTPFAELNGSLYEQGMAEGWLEMPNQWMAQKEALALTEQSDALLLLQPQSKIQVPGKLFEYVCIGRPIVAVVPRDSAVEWLLSRSGIPYVCLYPTDAPEEIDRKFEAFLQLPNTPVPMSDWFQHNFDAAQQARDLVSLIETV